MRQVSSKYFCRALYELLLHLCEFYSRQRSWIWFLSHNALRSAMMSICQFALVHPLYHLCELTCKFYNPLPLLFSCFLHDDIICDRPHYDGTLAGVAISCEWMTFNLTYSEPPIHTWSFPFCS
jgi:hypothetical protein